jgi:hypothetical protein
MPFLGCVCSPAGPGGRGVGARHRRTQEPRYGGFLKLGAVFGCRVLSSRRDVRYLRCRRDVASGVGCPARVYYENRCYKVFDFYNSNPHT